MWGGCGVSSGYSGGKVTVVGGSGCGVVVVLVVVVVVLVVVVR